MVFVLEMCMCRNIIFTLDLLGFHIRSYLSEAQFLFYGIFKGIRNDPTEVAGGHTGDLALWKQFRKNRAEIDRGIVIGNRSALFFLMDPSEYFADTPRRITLGRPAENVGTVIEDYLGQFLAVIHDQLVNTLNAQYGRDQIRPSGIDYSSESHDKNCRQLVQDHSERSTSGLVGHLQYFIDVQSDWCGIDFGAVGIVLDTDDLWLFGIVDIQPEIVPGHDVVDFLAGQHGERYLCTGGLPCQFLPCLSLHGVLEGNHQCPYLQVLHHDFQQIFDTDHGQGNGMGQGAYVLAQFLGFFLKVPDQARNKANGALGEKIAALYPVLVEVLHYYGSRIRCIGLVPHQIGVYWITAVGFFDIVKTDHIEFGQFFGMLKFGSSRTLLFSSQIIIGNLT